MATVLNIMPYDEASQIPGLSGNSSYFSDYTPSLLSGVALTTMGLMNKVTIYHNPRCSKSRQTLELLKERDIDPEIILYLETAPSSSELTTLVSLLGMTPRELLRTSELEYKEMRLDDTDLSDADIIKAMVDAPILIQRPIVVCGDRASLGRPPEQVLDIISI